mgnify:FL=1
MKETRAGISILVFIISAHLAFLLPQTSQSRNVTAGYAPTSCPGPVSGARSTLLLPAERVPTKYLASLGSDFRKTSTGSFTLSQGAIVVQGDPRNSLEIQSKAGQWTSGTTCSSGSTESWFVGGSAGVTSQSKLAIENSGLSDATVELTTFSENGPSAATSVTISAASEKTIRLDALNPGANKIVTRLRVLSGRVTAFMLDERVKGLKNLGADFVPASPHPSTSVIIGGIPSSIGKDSKVQTILRILAPGAIDGTASVEVLSSNGVFVPIGLGEIALNSQDVTEISLPNLQVGTENFALRIDASIPIVAGVYVEGKRGSLSDFSWHGALTPFKKSTFNIYGLQPTITFISKNISVSAEWSDSRGKVYRSTIKGEEVVNWKVPANVRMIQLVSFTGTSAAMSWVSGDGLATLGILGNPELSSSTRPVAEISVIQPSH